VPLDQWSFVAVVVGGTCAPTGCQVTLYVNGASVTRDVSGAFSTLLLPDLAIGGQLLQNTPSSPPSATFGFGGRIEDVSLWNRALSPTEVQALRAQVICRCGSSGLVGNWRFNDPAGSQSVRDCSAAANHGFLGVSIGDSANDPAIAVEAPIPGGPAPAIDVGGGSPEGGAHGIEGSLCEGTVATFGLNGATAGHPAVLLIGSAPALELAQPCQSLLPNTLAPFLSFLTAQAAVSSTGTTSIALTIPPGLQCAEFFSQWVTIDPATLELDLSNALHLVFP
jgi:hypothetical protein